MKRCRQRFQQEFQRYQEVDQAKFPIQEVIFFLYINRKTPKKILDCASTKATGSFSLNTPLALEVGGSLKSHKPVSHVSKQ